MTIAPPSEPANSASSLAIEHEAGTEEGTGESSDAERIRHVQSPTWIGYTRANRILERMEDLLAHPPTTRMPNLLVVGESGNGKTHLLARFVRRHAAYDHASRSAAAVPVVSILAPPVPEETRFYGAILDYVHAPQRDRDPASAKYRQWSACSEGWGPACCSLTRSSRYSRVRRSSNASSSTCSSTSAMSSRFRS